MKLLHWLRTIKKHFVHYDPSVKILISKTNLLHNLKEYQKKYPTLLCAPVLKSNAYGHGLIPIAQILDKQQLPFFVLDSLYEAMLLRDAGIHSKILIIGYTSADNIRHSTLAHIAFVITSLEQLQEVANAITTTTTIHLKIDTGMHRQGILPHQIPDALHIIQANTFLSLDGVCSHFADADNPDATFTKSQIVCWEKAVAICKQQCRSIQYFHISATSGALYSKQISGNVIRLGLGLYGIPASSLYSLDLKPVLRMQSVISSIKHLKAGERIGYNGTYTTPSDITVATVPVGYFEGIDRRLSNCGHFTIGTTLCPIVGRVSMNITSIDVTQTPSAKLGDKVTLISNNRNESNSVEKIASLIQMIPYEFLVHIPQHIRRTIIEH